MATFLIAGQASALQVTMGGAVTAQCGNASMSVTPDGNVSISCGTGTTTSATFTLSAPASLSPNITTVNQVQVNRSGSTIDSINVPYTVTGCTSGTSTLTFGPSVTSQAIALVTPASGSCGITLGAPSSPGVLGTPNSATIAIVDPDANVSFTFTAASSATQIAAAAYNLTVQRSGGSNGAWNVPYTVGGTTSVATVGGTGTLSFAAGSSNATVSVTPAATPPAGVTLPASLTVTLGTAVQTSGSALQLGSLGAIPTHTVTVGAASDCPAPPAGMMEANFTGAGAVLIQLAASGQVTSIPMPIPPWSGTTAQIIVTGTPAAATPSPVVLEMSINKCKGKIDTDITTTYCNVKNDTLTAYSTITWQGVAVSPYNNPTKAFSRGWCYAPYADGQYYLNTRWTYGSCPPGVGVCGFSIQYN